MNLLIITYKDVFFYLISKLPFPVLYVLSDIAAFVARRIVQYRKNTIIDNLKNSFPGFTEEQINRIVPDFYRNLSDVFLETLKLLSIRERDLLRRVKIKNIDLMNKYYLQKKTVIATTSHLCNWEWMLGAFSLQFPAPVDGVYQKIENPFFDRLMIRIRSRFGAFPVEKNDAFRESLRKRHIPHVIALVADQSPPAHEENVHWTSFLNRRTAFYNGMDRLGRTFNWPVVYAEMKRKNRGFYEIVFKELEPNPKNTAQGSIVDKYAESVEESIRENPPHWLWSHNRWKHKE